MSHIVFHWCGLPVKVIPIVLISVRCSMSDWVFFSIVVWLLTIFDSLKEKQFFFSFFIASSRKLHVHVHCKCMYLIGFNIHGHVQHTVTYNISKTFLRK